MRSPRRKVATPKASELVTGDVIRLRLGDIVPADARLQNTFESSMTRSISSQKP
jgi:magnesium-transporting ATPase (P-type)